MAATKGSSTETIFQVASTGVIGVILMFHSSNYRPTHYALLLAGCSLLALELSAAIAPARGDDGRFDLAEDMGARTAEEVDKDREHDNDRRFHLEHGSLVISSSTYDPTEGALATLTIGTT